MMCRVGQTENTMSNMLQMLQSLVSTCEIIQADVSNNKQAIKRYEDFRFTLVDVLALNDESRKLRQRYVNLPVYCRVESDLASSIESLRLDMQKMQRRVDEVHAALTLLGDVSMSKKKKPLKDVLF